MLTRFKTDNIFSLIPASPKLAVLQEMNSKTGLSHSKTQNTTTTSTIAQTFQNLLQKQSNRSSKNKEVRQIPISTRQGLVTSDSTIYDQSAFQSQTHRHRKTISSQNLYPSKITQRSPQNKLLLERRNLVKIQKLEKRKYLNIKTDWRELQKYQMFDDYLRIRDSSGLQGFKQQEVKDAESPNARRKSLLFGTKHQEIAYLADKRRQTLSQLREQNIQKQNPITSRNPIKHHISTLKKDNSLLQQSLLLLSKIENKLMVSQVDIIQVWFDDLIQLLSTYGIINFYLLAYFLNSIILQLFGRIRQCYTKWKKFLRVCNIQGDSFLKYKLVGYKYVAKQCLDLVNYEKARIYTQKLLKLSWVIDDRSYELLAYDYLAIIYYYDHDLEKANFFHNKFITGDFEQKGMFNYCFKNFNKDNKIRQIGETTYLFNQQLKNQLLDKNSFSEDDFDVNSIIEGKRIRDWEIIQKIREKQKEITSQKGYLIQKTQPIRPNQKLYNKKICDFDLKKLERLGPLDIKERSEKKEQKDDKSFLSFIRYQKSYNEKELVPILINHQSPLRVIQYHLLHTEQMFSRQILQVDQAYETKFRPVELMEDFKKLIRVFKFDVQFYLDQNYLFNNAVTDL